MRIVGEKWSAGELSVAAEHAGSHVVRTLLANLVRLVTPPAPAPTALLACFGEEQHEIGLLGFALHVASWGYRPLYLGARTPPKALAEAIAAHRPAFVALSVVIAPPLEDARDLLRGYQRVLDDTPWIVGGPAAHEIADLVRRRGGHLAGPRQEDTRALVGRLLHPAVARHA
jgi:methanogenic corrinoid protein MtbC1